MFWVTSQKYRTDSAVELVDNTKENVQVVVIVCRCGSARQRVLLGALKSSCRMPLSDTFASDE